MVFVLVKRFSPRRISLLYKTEIKSVTPAELPDLGMWDQKTEFYAKKKKKNQQNFSKRAGFL